MDESGAARGQALLGPMWAGLTPDSKGESLMILLHPRTRNHSQVLSPTSPSLRAYNGVTPAGTGAPVSVQVSRSRFRGQSLAELSLLSL